MFTIRWKEIIRFGGKRSPTSFPDLREALGNYLIFHEPCAQNRTGTIVAEYTSDSQVRRKISPPVRLKGEDDVKKLMGILCGVLLLLGSFQSIQAYEFVDNFDLFGNTQYLYSTTNAQVHHEHWGGGWHVDYWGCK